MKPVVTRQKYTKASAAVIIQRIDFQEKQVKQPVPQTDTGSWDENSKVLERFMAKELGKIDP